MNLKKSMIPNLMTRLITLFSKIYLKQTDEILNSATTLFDEKDEIYEQKKKHGMAEEGFMDFQLEQLHQAETTNKKYDQQEIKGEPRSANRAGNTSKPFPTRREGTQSRKR